MTDGLSSGQRRRLKPFDARRALLERVSERELTDFVVTTAHAAGWKGFHAYSSRRSPPGWPDWSFVRASELVFAELKTMRGRLTADQDDWLARLSQVQTVETHVWRPSDAAAIRARLNPGFKR